MGSARTVEGRMLALLVLLLCPPVELEFLGFSTGAWFSDSVMGKYPVWTPERPMSACLRLRNQGANPVALWGNCLRDPVYLVESRSRRGWVKVGPGWCGTGLTRHILVPGDFVDLRLPVPAGEQPFRFAISLRRRGDSYACPIYSPALVRAPQVRYRREHDPVIARTRGNVRGRVLDRDGRPLAGARVTLEEYRGGPFAWGPGGATYGARTDASGEFAIHAVRPGRYLFCWSVTHWKPSDPSPAEEPSEMSSRFPERWGPFANRKAQTLQEFVLAAGGSAWIESREPPDPVSVGLSPDEYSALWVEAFKAWSPWRATQQGPPPYPVDW